MQIDKEKIKNILLVRNDRFGEFILNIPAFRAIKTAYPDAKLALIVNPYILELAKLIKDVDDAIIWENKRHRLNQILRLSKEIKRRNFDLCVIFNPAKEFNLMTFFAGIPMRVGYSRKWGFLLTHKIKDEKYLGLKHEVEYNLDLACLAGAETEDKSIALKIDENADSVVKDFGLEGDFIVLHPWTSDPVKQWPFDNFVGLAKMITGKLGINLVIIGGKEETDKDSTLFRNIGANIINLTGKTSLLQLAAVLKRAKLLVSGDSGPVHLACAVGSPVLAIFRNDIPAKSAKRWGPWGSRHIVIEKGSLSDISVDEVFNKTKERLSETRNPASQVGVGGK